jgi:hypothetical protein
VNPLASRSNVFRSKRPCRFSPLYFLGEVLLKEAVRVGMPTGSNGSSSLSVLGRSGVGDSEVIGGPVLRVIIWILYLIGYVLILFGF